MAGAAGGVVVFGEGSVLGGGQGSESGMPRDCKTWKLPQKLFHPELRRQGCPGGRRRRRTKSQEPGPAQPCNSGHSLTLCASVSPGEGVGPSVCQYLGPGITAFESPWEQVKCTFPCPGPGKEALWSPDLGLCVWHSLSHFGGFPGGSAIKNLPANTGDSGSVPGSRRAPGGGHGNPL